MPERSKPLQGASSWRGRVGTLSHLIAFQRMMWHAHRRLLVAVVVLRIVRGLVPVSVLWVGKLIVDGIVTSRATGADWEPLLGLLAGELAIVMTGELLARASMVMELSLTDAVTAYIDVMMMRHAAILDLASVEEAAFADLLTRARRQSKGRTALIGQLLSVADSSVTIVTLAIALVSFSPWLSVLLLVTSLPGFVGEIRFGALQYSLLSRWTQRRRQLDYLQQLGTSVQSVKETQLFGLTSWLIERYTVVSDVWRVENRRLATKRALASSSLSLIGALGYYGAYVAIVARTVNGGLTLGSMTFLVGSFARGRDLIRSLLVAMSSIYDESLYLGDLFTFLRTRPSIASRPGAAAVPVPIRRGWVFEDVGFRYRDAERWALRHVTLHLKAGERLAIVGENGAGKTTLTKLLARLYDPAEGRILLDGVDLRDYDLDSLRKSIGVIFQDFVRYDMCFDENIGVGNIVETQGYLASAERAARLLQPEMDGMLDGETPVPHSLRAAARQSLACELLPRLPDGWHQMLGRRFDGGVELSGGEWQRVALARAHLRQAQTLILDEPTAALDARAEYEVYRRFAELMRGRSALIISHRLSTVRMADRIVVLQDGGIVEEGTHDALLASTGLYSELFEMQASGYR